MDGTWISSDSSDQGTSQNEFKERQTQGFDMQEHSEARRGSNVGSLFH